MYFGKSVSKGRVMIGGKREKGWTMCMEYTRARRRKEDKGYVGHGRSVDGCPIKRKGRGKEIKICNTD